MKLIKCYIENFGTISKKEIEFDSKINIFEQENGWGKTTLAVFIKTMLYGFDKTTKRKELSEREKYKPWNNGKYGGSLEIEIQNKRYRIERFFGDTPKSDTFVLTDLSTNKETNTYAEKIGEEIFKLDKQSFERSIYIPQQTIEVQISNDLTTKLTNLDNLQDDMNKYEDAKDKLSKKSDELKKKIKLIDANIKELENKIENCDKTQLIYEEYKKQNEIKEQEICKIKEEVSAIENKIKILNEQKLKQEIMKQYNNLILEENQIKDKKEKLQSFFKGNIPTEEQIENIETCISVIQIEKNKLNEIEETKQNFSNYDNLTDEELQNKMKFYQEYKSQKGEIESIEKSNEIKQLKYKELSEKKEKYILEFAAIIVGIMLSIFVKNKAIGIIVLVLAIVSIILKLVSPRKTKEKKKLEKEIKKLEMQIEQKINLLEDSKNKLYQFITNLNKEFQENAIYESLYEIQTSFLDYKKMLQTKLLTENTINAKTHEIEKFLYQYFSEINNEYKTYIDFIKYNIKDNKDTENKYNEIINREDKFLKEYNIEALKQSANVEESSEDLEEKLKFAKLQEETLIQNIITLQRQMESFLSVIEEKSELEDEKHNLKNELENLKHKKYIIDLTLEMFEKTKEKLSIQYLGGMNENLNKYISFLTDDEKLKNINIDIDLNTKVEIEGEKKQIDFFSAGNKDLIGICTRFSLIDSIFKDEKPFLILDDPFVNLDKEKIEKALELIKKVSNEFQIIYFTCHESRT